MSAYIICVFIVTFQHSDNELSLFLLTYVEPCDDSIYNGICYE